MILDGSVIWGDAGPRPAAPGFDMAARRETLYEWVRQVRGGILAGTCIVERHISVAITHFILGDRINLPEVQSAFDEKFLAPMSFDRRINLVVLIASHVLAMEETASLNTDLGQLRKLRNAMAHRPFWFSPSLNDGGEIVQITPMIMDGKEPLPLTTPLIETVNKLIAGLITRTDQLATTIAKHPPAISPSSLEATEGPAERKPG